MVLYALILCDFLLLVSEVGLRSVAFIVMNLGIESLSVLDLVYIFNLEDVVVHRIVGSKFA